MGNDPSDRRRLAHRNGGGQRRPRRRRNARLVRWLSPDRRTGRFDLGLRARVRGSRLGIHRCGRRRLALVRVGPDGSAGAHDRHRRSRRRRPARPRDGCAEHRDRRGGVPAAGLGGRLDRRHHASHDRLSLGGCGVRALREHARNRRRLDRRRSPRASDRRAVRVRPPRHSWRSVPVRVRHAVLSTAACCCSTSPNAWLSSPTCGGRMDATAVDLARGMQRRIGTTRRMLDVVLRGLGRRRPRRPRGTRDLVFRPGRVRGCRRRLRRRKRDDPS